MVKGLQKSGSNLLAQVKEPIGSFSENSNLELFEKEKCKKKQAIRIEDASCEDLMTKKSFPPKAPESIASQFTKEEKQNTFYNEKYFSWQKDIGFFGGVANLFKFSEFIDPSDAVIDFGCGGGYLLNNINCREKIGIEINGYARKEASSQGLYVVDEIEVLNNEIADIIISNHALEHVERPFDVLKSLLLKLKIGGKIVFVVPHQNTKEEYDAADKNNHLYTWNQMTLGNLFAKAGYKVLRSEAFQHQWPPDYADIYAKYGQEEFHRICKKHAIENDNYQIRIVATKQNL